MKPRTTSVGSLPRPRALLRARWLHAEGEIDDNALREATATATRAVLERQAELGLDLFVDGQMDRGDMVTHFAAGLDGVEAGGLVRCYGNRYYHMPRVTGALARTAALSLDGWRLARGLTEGPLKATVTGPYTLMHCSGNEFYDTREACCMAFATAVAAEIGELLDAGVDEIQLDEPAFGARRDELELGLESMRRATSCVEGRARSWAHVCYGDPDPPLESVLKLPVDGVMLGMLNPSDAQLERLAALPPDKLLAAGVVDAAGEVVESPRCLDGRVSTLLDHVPPERLWLAPDGGLRGLDDALAWGKLAALARAGAAEDGR